MVNGNGLHCSHLGKYTLHNKAQPSKSFPPRAGFQ